MKEDFYYSQSSLGTFKRCPKMFEYIYRDGISGKGVDPQLKKNIDRGTNFHILAERYFNGMKDYFYIKDDQLLEWMTMLEEKYPEDIDCRSEFEIRQDKDEIRLMAKYDLIVIEGDKISFIPWEMDEESENELDSYKYEKSDNLNIVDLLMENDGSHFCETGLLELELFNFGQNQIISENEEDVNEYSGNFLDK